jgi:hypothetical protein
MSSSKKASSDESGLVRLSAKILQVGRLAPGRRLMAFMRPSRIMVLKVFLQTLRLAQASEMVRKEEDI